MGEPKNKYADEKDICCPKLFFLDYSNTTCWELKKKIFSYVLPIIKHPEEILDSLEKKSSED